MSIPFEELDRSTIDELTREWPEKPSDLADELVEEYGLPDDVTKSGSSDTASASGRAWSSLVLFSG